jgi:hypothetical protein
LQKSLYLIVVPETVKAFFAATGGRDRVKLYQMVVSFLLLAVVAQADLTLEKLSGPAAGGAVLDVGAAGAFDAAWASCPCVLRIGGKYRMWYSAVFDSKQGRGGIGVAESDDGLEWRRLNDGRPVLDVGLRGSFDDGQVMGPEVHFDGALYRMWYTGMSREWHASGFGHYRIGLALSDDGIAWRRENDGRPVLDLGPPGSADEVQAATPTIVREGDSWRMWYAAWSPTHNHTICSARSTDGIRWTREDRGEPIAGLDPSIAFGQAVARVGDRYLLVYQALKATRGLYAAESRDGRKWTMLHGGEPILSPGEPDDFDAAILGHPHMLVEGDRVRLWYHGFRREADGPAGAIVRIGTAELNFKPSQAAGNRP